MKTGFFQEDNGNWSQARLQMFLGFLLASFYLIYGMTKGTEVDIAIFYGLLAYSASIKIFQKFAEIKKKEG